MRNNEFNSHSLIKLMSFFQAIDTRITVIKHPKRVPYSISLKTQRDVRGDRYVLSHFTPSLSYQTRVTHPSFIRHDTNFWISFTLGLVASINNDLVYLYGVVATIFVKKETGENIAGLLAKKIKNILFIADRQPKALFKRKAGCDCATLHHRDGPKG